MAARSRRPTLLDVATAAGVSKSTVSRVVNGEGYVTEEKRSTITSVMERLGYSPNHIAQSLRTQRTYTVGFVVPNFTNEIYAANAEGATQILEPTGRTLLVSTAGVDGHRQLDVLRSLINRAVEGLILSLADETPQPVVELLASTDVPIVLVDRDMPAVKAADRVLIDHSAVAEAAAELRRLGHRRVLLVAPPEQIRPGREVATAFRSVYPRGRVRHVPLTFDAGQRTIGQALAEPPGRRPTGVIVCGTSVLAGVVTVVRRLGLAMPEDLSLVGYDESAISQLYDPQIATISRDTIGLGIAAGELLVSRIDDGRRRPMVTELASHYFTASSVGPPPR